MEILKGLDFPDYQLLDSGNGMRLERLGLYTLSRPDPQCIWQPHLSPEEWGKAEAIFVQEGKQGRWTTKTAIPEKWLLRYNDIAFFAKLTPFKHTGVFPEQSAQWEWLRERIMNHESGIKNNKANVLNLFGYTGIASLVCAAAGAAVTHVDASKPAIAWARENQAASGLSDKPIRWILDDALTFVQREIRRGVRYDGIIMDPPVYGHGPDGKPWDFHKDMPKLLAACRQVLSDQPLFILINAYAISSSALMLQNLLQDLGLQGKITVGELVLSEIGTDRLLSTGIFGRWSSK